jgi:hypothetical protein
MAKLFRVVARVGWSGPGAFSKIPQRTLVELFGLPVAALMR